MRLKSAGVGGGGWGWVEEIVGMSSAFVIKYPYIDTLFQARTARLLTAYMTYLSTCIGYLAIIEAE